MRPSLALGIACWFIGCGATAGDEPSAALAHREGSGRLDGQVLRIPRNVGFTLGVLRIEAGGIREARYTDGEGRARRGLTASLSVRLPGQPIRAQQLRVHAGQRVAAREYRFEVLSIDTHSVQLAVYGAGT